MTRILVIEDERQIREVLKQVLLKANFEVETAANGIEGLQKFRSAPADLVITDILMPEKDGLETIEELTREFKELPIIAISGGGPGARAQYALDLAEQYGAVWILAKPFSRKDILAAIEEALPAQPATSP
ncbi:MAG: response regulator [Magnetococcales bacterium]|nr:response regulator [Magnetococcales bacterium]